MKLNIGKRRKILNTFYVKRNISNNFFSVRYFFFFLNCNEILFYYLLNKEKIFKHYNMNINETLQCLTI